MQRLALVLAFLGLACVCGRSVAAFDEDLHAAIRKDDVEAVRSKLAKGVDLEPVCRPNFNCKPLVYAAFLGRRQIVEMLVDAGADLNGTSPVGDTALIKSLILRERQLDRELAKYLIMKGADVNKPNVFGISAFIGVCAIGDLEMINLMLAHGAKVDSAFPNRISPRPPERTDEDTCLHKAIMEGHLEAARLILRAGADPKVRNSGGKLPEYYAERAGRKDLVDLLQMESAANSTIPAKDAPERKCDRPTTAFPSEALSKIGSTPVRTTIRFKLLGSGQVGEVKIKESSGHKVLDDAAVIAILKMKCTPLAASEQSEWLETWYEFTVR